MLGTDAEGMRCEHCEDPIENALTDVDSVADATADSGVGAVSYEGDPDAVTVAAAVRDAGDTPPV